MATQQQIDSFHQFASRHLGAGNAELSMDDLFDLWQAEHSIDLELTESAAAVQAALADMEQGDSGRPLHEFLAELRGRQPAANE